jgi:hypothetical protein
MRNQTPFRKSEPGRQVKYLPALRPRRRQIAATRFHLDQFAIDLAKEWNSSDDSLPQFLYAE